MLYKTNISQQLLFLPLLKNLLVLLLLSKITIAAENNNDSSLLFIASSTNEVIKEAADQWVSDNIKHNFRLSAASSGALAKQIISGAPVNLFISASKDWIIELQEKRLIESDSIQEVFGNKLVLITHINNKYKKLGLIENESLIKEFLYENLKKSRLSIADNSHVPAGIYTQQALKNLGMWNDLYPQKLAFAGDVRKALKFVSTGASPLGIVYYSDTLLEPEIKIIGTFSEKLHSPIRYWAAMTVNSNNPITEDFFKFLVSVKAQKIISKYGFINIKR